LARKYYFSKIKTTFATLLYPKIHK